jgi:hypothetical protein
MGSRPGTAAGAPATGRSVRSEDIAICAARRPSRRSRACLRSRRTPDPISASAAARFRRCAGGPEFAASTRARRSRSRAGRSARVNSPMGFSPSCSTSLVVEVSEVLARRRNVEKIGQRKRQKRAESEPTGINRSPRQSRRSIHSPERSPDLPTQAGLHSSGRPALRRPSNTAGRFGECSFTHLTVIAGLRRRASASSPFASSILPACA